MSAKRKDIQGRRETAELSRYLDEGGSIWGKGGVGGERVWCVGGGENENKPRTGHRKTNE